MDEPKYCPACLSLQPADAAFCLRCGADLSIPPPRALPTPSRPVPAERGDFEAIFMGLRESGRVGGGPYGALVLLVLAVVFWLVYKLYLAVAWSLAAAWRTARHVSGRAA